MKKKSTTYWIVIVLLALLLGGLIVVYVQQRNRFDAIQMQFVAERDSLTAHLRNMQVEYENMRIDNEEIAEELELEKKKIRVLIQKMHTAEQINYNKIRNYEKETNTLRAIMRNYIHQIDSLNTLSQKLLAENKEVKQSLHETRQQNEVLAAEKKVLSQQVEIGSRLIIRNLEGEGLNSRDKSTKQASRTKKIKTCFTINANSIAQAGARFVYVSIVDGNQKVLTKSINQTVEIEGKEVLYSARREIDFTGEEVETCVYFDAGDDKLLKGKYEIQVFMDGYNAGMVEFLLK
ncbi:hypothetical protein AGMMS4956_14770 [Bacteroidia bacterium]|nr:hypothetical protein AGMMS4956_14770 [Bacteroidia bacterium]